MVRLLFIAGFAGMSALVTGSAQALESICSPPNLEIQKKYSEYQKKLALSIDQKKVTQSEYLSSVYFSGAHVETPSPEIRLNPEASLINLAYSIAKFRQDSGIWPQSISAIVAEYADDYVAQSVARSIDPDHLIAMIIEHERKAADQTFLTETPNVFVQQVLDRSQKEEVPDSTAVTVAYRNLKTFQNQMNHKINFAGAAFRPDLLTGLTHTYEAKLTKDRLIEEARTRTLNLIGKEVKAKGGQIAKNLLASDVFKLDRARLFLARASEATANGIKGAAQRLVPKGIITDGILSRIAGTSVKEAACVAGNSSIISASAVGRFAGGLGAFLGEAAIAVFAVKMLVGERRGPIYSGMPAHPEKLLAISADPAGIYGFCQAEYNYRSEFKSIEGKSNVYLLESAQMTRDAAKKYAEQMKQPLSIAPHYETPGTTAIQKPMMRNP